MPGPLPKPDAARRNAPTIPTTNLPASGRSEPAPDVPEWTALGERGLAWWAWAWSTPQACAWSVGDISSVARRASLEDDLRVLESADSLDYALEDIADSETMAQVKAIIGKLSALVSGRTSVLREMRELDDRLGLTPKAMAALRWKIIDDGPAKPNLASVSAPDFKKRAV